CSSCAGTNVLF
nr:immunoglobulin light chain junction region [Macaca mulatta]